MWFDISAWNTYSKHVIKHLMRSGIFNNKAHYAIFKMLSQQVFIVSKTEVIYLSLHTWKGNVFPISMVTTWLSTLSNYNFDYNFECVSTTIVSWNLKIPGVENSLLHISYLCSVHLKVFCMRWDSFKNIVYLA